MNVGLTLMLRKGKKNRAKNHQHYHFCCRNDEIFLLSSFSRRFEVMSAPNFIAFPRKWTNWRKTVCGKTFIILFGGGGGNSLMAESKMTLMLLTVRISPSSVRSGRALKRLERLPDGADGQLALLTVRQWRQRLPLALRKKARWWCSGKCHLRKS